MSRYTDVAGLKKKSEM